MGLGSEGSHTGHAWTPGRHIIAMPERVRDRELAPEYVATTDNWADGQTKSLPAPTFARFATEVCVTAHPRPHTRVR